MDPTEFFLAILLRDDPELRISDEKPTRNLHLFGQKFTQVIFDREQAAFLGFYDLVRDRIGTLVGVRLSLGTHAATVRERLPQWDYITWESDRTFRVLFALDSNVVEDNPYEQAFGDTRLFASRSGDLVLTFQTDFLAPSDLGVLDQYTASQSETQHGGAQAVEQHDANEVDPDGEGSGDPG